jgi:diguanylate cyclase (GGDEF)-like protein/PAS domain S-box-containing protein
VKRKSTAEAPLWVSEHQALPSRRTAVPVAALAAVFGALLLLVPVLASFLLEDETAHTATRLATVAAALAAVFAAADAARRNRGSLRWGWGLLAAAATGWALSNLIAAYSELVEGMRLPVPSTADIPAALAVVLGAAAVVALLGAVLPSAARMRALLDGLLIASTLLFVSWELALRQVFLDSGEGPEQALALGYPLADVAVLALLLVSLSRLKLSGPWLFLLLGFGLHAVSRAAFAYLDLVRIEDSGLESAIWIAGTLSIAAAALPGGATFERRRAAPRAGTAADVLVPCIPLAIALAFAGRRLSQGPLETFLLMNAGAIVVLLVARQLLAQVEYLELYRQLEASVMHGLDVLTVVGPGGVIVQQTGPVERVLGYRTGQLIGKAFRDLVHPQGREEILPIVFAAQPPPAAPTSLQLLLQRGDGEWALTETTISDLSRHPDVGGYLLTSRDAGARKGLDSQLSPETLNDPLTGVGNRVLFLDRLSTAVRRSALTPELITVVVVDIDGFTDINNSLGHAMGDQLLVEAADRLKAVLRKEDTLARLGADEFGILLESDEDSPMATAERVVSRLRQPMDLQGRSVLISASEVPTLRSTRPGPPDVRASRCSAKTCTCPLAGGWRSSPTCDEPWRTKSCSSTSNPSLICRVVGSPEPKHWCVGTGRTAGWWPRESSWRSPRKAISPSAWAAGSWKKPAAGPKSSSRFTPLSRCSSWR